jgi:hypothetical protein
MKYFSGRVAEKKHARSLKRLNVTTKQNRVNTAIQIRKQKLQTNREARQTIGAIDGVPQIIVMNFNYILYETNYPFKIATFMDLEVLRDFLSYP